MILTQEEVIEQFKKIHGDKYDYSLVNYKNNQTPVKIICPKHGVFEQKPTNHKKGAGCPKCIKRTKDIEQVLEDFKKTHGDKYDYSKVVYIKHGQKVEIICPKHGSFFQKPILHKSGSGCVKCKNQNLILDKDKVIEQCIKKHNNKYDYSLVEYIKGNIPVKIICPEHGIFEQSLYNHKNGAGCIKCHKNMILNNDKTLNQFKEIHNNKYDYSLVDFTSAKQKIKIICPEHGIFEQVANQHLKGYGCKKCSTQKLFLSKEKVIFQFEETHNNKYNYSLVEYKSTKEKVQIICPEHGIFNQDPLSHKKGSGCPQCSTNKKEEFLTNLFKDYNIPHIYNNREIIKPLEIDILIPDFKFGIEHNGILWHSYGISNWSATNNYHLLNKNRHLEKTIKMEEQGYQLFHIREDHLLNKFKKEIWKSVLLNKCGFSNKIHARKLNVIDLSNYQEFTKTFLEENHLQGSCPASIKLGLQDPKTGIVYSIMTFGKSRFDKNIEYELLRFCNLKFHNVRGAASKLLNFFERTYKPNSLVSYANRDWSQGNLYNCLGFILINNSQPNYFYIDNNLKIISRIQVQKHKLKAFLEARNQVFNENLSERDNMINNGYRIYYDTGNLVYHKIY